MVSILYVVEFRSHWCCISPIILFYKRNTNILMVCNYLGPSIISFFLQDPTMQWSYFKWGLCVVSLHQENYTNSISNSINAHRQWLCTESELCIPTLHKFPTTLIICTLLFSLLSCQIILLLRFPTNIHKTPVSQLISSVCTNLVI